jgi:hypothetical protein
VTRARIAAVALGLVLLLAGAAVATWRPWESPPRVLVDARVRLGDAGAWVGFTVDAPGTIEIRVDLPEGVATEVVHGPLGATPPGGDPLAPVPSSAERSRVEGAGGEPIRRSATAPGRWVVRVAPVPVAMGSGTPTARVRVTVR